MTDLVKSAHWHCFLKLRFLVPQLSSSRFCPDNSYLTFKKYFTLLKVALAQSPYEMMK